MYVCIYIYIYNLNLGGPEYLETSGFQQLSMLTPPQSRPAKPRLQNPRQRNRPHCFHRGWCSAARPSGVSIGGFHGQLLMLVFPESSSMSHPDRATPNARLGRAVYYKMIDYNIV